MLDLQALQAENDALRARVAELEALKAAMLAQEAEDHAEAHRLTVEVQALRCELHDARADADTLRARRGTGAGRR